MRLTRTTVLAIVLAMAALLQADAPMQTFAAPAVDHATLTQGGEMYSCETVNCRQRVESGRFGWLSYSAGDTVIAWRVRPEDRYDARPHPCILENASTWGRLYDGVRNPWRQELDDAYRSGWQRC